MAPTKMSYYDANQALSAIATLRRLFPDWAQVGMDSHDMRPSLDAMEEEASAVRDAHLAESARRENERLDTPVMVKFPTGTPGDVKFVEMALNRRKRYTVVIQQAEHTYWHGRKLTGKTTTLRHRSPGDSYNDWIEFTSEGGQRRRVPVAEIVSITEDPS